MSGMLFLGACDNDDSPKGNGSENVPQKVLAAFERDLEILQVTLGTERRLCGGKSDTYR